MYKNKNNLSAKYNKQISLVMWTTQMLSPSTPYIFWKPHRQWENLPNFSSSEASSVCLSTHLPEEKERYMSGMSPVIIF